MWKSTNLPWRQKNLVICIIAESVSLGKIQTFTIKNQIEQKKIELTLLCCSLWIHNNFDLKVSLEKMFFRKKNACIHMRKILLIYIFLPKPVYFQRIYLIMIDLVKKFSPLFILVVFFSFTFCLLSNQNCSEVVVLLGTLGLSYLPTVFFKQTYLLMFPKNWKKNVKKVHYVDPIFPFVVK